MWCNSQSTSTEKPVLSIFSSILFFTADINCQSRLVVPFADGIIGSESISRLAYLLRNNALLANKFAILAFNILTLKGLTIYASAPIDIPSRMLFSSPKAVSSSTGICDVSISFFIATHSSSPLISGIMISERIRSGQNSFAIISASRPFPQACTWYIEDNELTR